MLTFSILQKVVVGFISIHSNSPFLAVKSRLFYSSWKMATPKWGRFPCPIEFNGDVENPNFDTILVVSPSLNPVGKSLSENIFNVISKQSAVDESVHKEPVVIPYNENVKRIIYSETGPLDRDYDDVRRYSDATIKGIQKALKAGAKKISLAVIPDDKFPNATLVSLLAAFEALYSPLHYRLDEPVKALKLKELGVYGKNEKEIEKIIRIATALESGRFVCRDLGGSDPEVMAPPKFAEYVEKVFANTPITVETISDRAHFEKQYPLFAAVDRAASVIERHQGRIVILKYEGEGPITRTIMPVGKGVTYDTGGADVKAGGIMAGMSRDKCGAAAVAGFFQVLALLKPKGVKAIGAMSIVRNSIGENCYVADEIIVSRAGVRTRIGNTDAEGRMVMTDVLCMMKELAVNEINPHLFTIATLTGHVCLAVGNYTAVMDNGPAKRENFSAKIQKNGEELGDMIEISTLRREDYDFIKKGTGDGEDLLQCNNAASSRTPRGHQFPAAFMIEAAGLDKHGINSKKPLKYTHIDIAGSSGHVPDTPTSVPILALAKTFFGEQL